MFKNPPVWLIAIVARFVALVDWILPKSNRVVYVSQPDVSDNPLGLFLAQAKLCPDLDAVWLIRGDLEKARRRLCAVLGDVSYSRYRLVKKNSLAGVHVTLTSRVVCSSHTSYRFLWSSCRRISVSLWHGMPLKRIGLLDGKDVRLYGAITHCVASSEFFAGVMAKSFGLDRSRVWVSGQPRDDLMFLDSRKERLKRALGLADERLCVYMPTYRHAAIDDVRVDSARTEPSIPLIEGDLGRIDREFLSAGQKLIVKLHPMDRLNERQWPSDFRAIRVLTHQQFMDLESDVYELVGISDCLVTDFSSVFVDYLCLNRPVAFVHDVGDRYTRGLTVEGSLEEFLPGPVLKTTEEFLSFALAPPSWPGSYADRARCVQAFHDAKNGERVMRQIMAEIGAV